MAEPSTSQALTEQIAQANPPGSELFDRHLYLCCEHSNDYCCRISLAMLNRNTLKPQNL